MGTAIFGCNDFALHNTAKYAELPIHQRIARIIADIFCAVRHRTEMRKLITGDPRLLEDIGISQSDVMSAMSRSILTDPTEEVGERIDRRHDAWRKFTEQRNQARSL